jgi:hypothetical protein
MGLPPFASPVSIDLLKQGRGFCLIFKTHWRQAMKKHGSKKKMIKSAKKINPKPVKAHKKTKTQIQRHLKQGKTKLVWLENHVSGLKAGAKISATIEKSMRKVDQTKKKFNEYKDKAIHYTDENPKKALAMAVAGGALVGSIWNAFRKK